MPHSLLIDNWTLQSAGKLLSNGLEGKTTQDLAFSKNGQSFRYEEISADAICFEALCQLLTNIVFADKLLVDAAFGYTWSKYEPLQLLLQERLVAPTPFLVNSAKWILRREAIGEQLCVNPALRKAHQANKRNYSRKGKAKDPFLSQVLWGGAGMLARAAHFGLPYVPHPCRERLFARAHLLRGRPSAESQLKDFISSQRVKISERIDGTGFVAQLLLPAAAVLVIQDTEDLQDLPKTALQIRSEYRHLREWLAKFQRALDKEDTKAVLAERKTLDSVARHMDARVSLAPVGDTSLQFGLSWLRVTTKTGSPLNSLENMFGVRLELSRLIFAPAGRNALRKLLRMLGEDGTSRGLAFEQQILRRSATPAAACFSRI